MGVYINVGGDRFYSPPGAKEKWISENLTRITVADFFAYQFDPVVQVVILVENPTFTAAAVMHSAEELEYWRRSVRDGLGGRRVAFYKGDAKKIAEVSS